MNLALLTKLPSQKSFMWDKIWVYFCVYVKFSRAAFALWLGFNFSVTRKQFKFNSSQHWSITPDWGGSMQLLFLFFRESHSSMFSGIPSFILLLDCFHFSDSLFQVFFLCSPYLRRILLGRIFIPTMLLYPFIWIAKQYPVLAPFLQFQLKSSLQRISSWPRGKEQPFFLLGKWSCHA